MAQYAYLADALRRIVCKLPGDHDFGDAIAIDILSRAVDHVGKAGDQDVPLPGGVFVPDQIGAALRERDYVGLAVVVQIGDGYVITAAEIGSDFVRGEGERLGGGGKGKSDQQCGETHFYCSFSVPFAFATGSRVG